jgi:hydroxymethylglutaryl-CoA lyase
MLHAMGFETGIDLPRLLAVARRLPEVVGHDVPDHVAKAGLITDLHPVPSYVAELRSQFS